jgi:hypothetical protein
MLEIGKENIFMNKGRLRQSNDLLSAGSMKTQQHPT